MSMQVSRGSAGEYQADERAGIARTSWRLSVIQGKPFNITVIRVYAPTSNAEEAEVERFYEDLQDLLELTPKKDVLFIIGTGMQK